MAAITREEVRIISRDELRPDMDRMQGEIDGLKETLARTTEANAEANANVAKAVERLSLIVAGDPSIPFPGMIEDVRVLKEARQQTLIEKAKVSGIWIGGSTVAVVVGKLLWVLIDTVFKHP